MSAVKRQADADADRERANTVIVKLSDDEKRAVIQTVSRLTSERNAVVTISDVVREALTSYCGAGGSAKGRGTT